MSPPSAASIPAPPIMHISGLDLGAWITVYMGIMLARNGVPLSKVEGEPADPRRYIVYLGYGLLVLGIGIFITSLRMK